MGGGYDLPARPYTAALPSGSQQASGRRANAFQDDQKWAVGQPWRARDRGELRMQPEKRRQATSASVPDREEPFAFISHVLDGVRAVLQALE